MYQTKSVFGRYFFPIAVAGLYIFLYVPILILILFSFNAHEFSLEFTSFSLKWYKELFANAEVWDALCNSLIVALSSVILSLCMGVLFVFYSMNTTYFSKMYVMFYGNLAMPEIVFAVGLLSFFSLLSIPLGLTTLIAGHTIIGLGYVVPILYARFVELDERFTEAALDLGATQEQTLLKIIVPLMRSSLLAAALLVFIISLDDFVISFFCSGASTQTLPIYIFSMIRSGASPMISALSTILLGISSILVLIFSSLHVKKEVMVR